MGRAGLEKEPHQVAAMFDEVADGYDRANTFISLFQDRRWRRHMVRTLQLLPGHRVLDVAAGTAVSTAELARAGVWAVALDFSLGMLEGRPEACACRRSPATPPTCRSPTACSTRVTISFGLRNVQDPAAALAEFARVTRPGGQLLVCEVSRPRTALLRAGHRFHLRKVLPMMARRFSSNPAAYSYLAESTEAWMDPKDLGKTIAGAGWTSVAWRSMTFGVVALHHAIRDEH